MKHILSNPLFAAILLSFSSMDLHAQTPRPIWVKGISGTENVSGGGMVIDKDRNTYVIGSFSGTTDFDPGSGGVMLIGMPGNNGFIAKYDASGNYVFAFVIKAGLSGIVLDNSGNICVMGIHDTAADFDPGAGIVKLAPVSKYNYFIARYDKDGNYLNAFLFASGSSTVRIKSMAADANGNLLITGDFNSIANFNPGGTAFNLSANGSSNDIYLAKYSGSGSMIYAFRLGGTGNDNGEYLALDATGNTWLAGLFFSTIDLDPGSSLESFTFPGMNGFIAKYDLSGNYLAGYGYDPTIYSVAIDGSGNIYLSGHVGGTMDVDPGPGVVNLSSDKGNDIFISKLDSSGKFQYAYRLVSDGSNLESGMTTDEQNSIYLYGYITDTTYFNPKDSGDVQKPKGGRDGFVVKHDSAGKYVYSFSFGSTGNDNSMTVKMDKQGVLWMAGYFSGTVDFDPGAGIANLISDSGSGVFFVRYNDHSLSIGNPGSAQQSPRKIYGADNKVYVDFSALANVDATVKVVNMMGQMIAEAYYTGSDRMKIELPETEGQIYVVIVSNEGIVTAKKVWVY